VSEFELLRNVTIGQYLPTGSPLHRLDPRAKLWMAALLIAGAVATRSLLGLVVALIVVVGGIAIARVPLRYASRGVAPALPFLLFLAVLQVTAVPQNDAGKVIWSWWRVRVTTGDLHVATTTMLRFVVLILGISLFSMTTTTVELAHGVEHVLRPLQRIGMPAHEFSLVVVIALRFVPLLAMEAERIAKAQASRGADLGTRHMNVFKQAARALPLLVPLFVTALHRAETLALAMEARCYAGGRGRTRLIQLKASWADVWAVLGLAVLAAALLAATWLDVDRSLWRWLAR